MLSLSKVLLTVAVVLAVWFFGRMLARRAKLMRRTPKPPRSARATPVDLAKCTVCDVYVGADSSPCERPDCPQRA